MSMQLCPEKSDTNDDDIGNNKQGSSMETVGIPAYLLIVAVLYIHGVPSLKNHIHLAITSTKHSETGIIILFIYVSIARMNNDIFCAGVHMARYSVFIQLYRYIIMGS